MAALAVCERMPVAPVPHDFIAARTSDAPPYVVSIRPLVQTGRTETTNPQAVVMVFVHDPLRRNEAAALLLREMFGLTEAEASVAQALQSGFSPDEYASQRRISPNTVYTHVHRIKQKTGCRRMAQLIRRLNDLQVPLKLG
jgi:DNA-binding CsgD family transcriptional regulator